MKVLRYRLISVTLLYSLCLFIRTADYIHSFSIPRVEQIRNFDNGPGITSIIDLKDGTLIAGTKTGDVFQSRMDVDMRLIWSRMYGYESKLPVYSLAAERGKRVFCGGGDRCIAVWDEKEESFNQRLGPHTGWVKALTYLESKRILFSIGCNCIEAWNCTDSEISHIGKRTIENSVNASTLSSDLLDLCLVDDDLLVSSGVDGRVHLWTTDPKERDPLSCTNLHEGRITCLRHYQAKNTLFSIGNDGRICASEVSSAGINLKAEVKISNCPRLTTCLIINNDSNDRSNCSLALGTTEGQVVLVSVTFQEEDDISLVEKEKFDLPQGASVVYALCSLRKSQLLVGHSKGMECIKLI